MRVTVDVQQLNKGLSIVSRAVSTKHTIPVLGGIHLAAESDKLTLRATDLDMSMETSVPCQAERVGEVIASARHLVELVSKMDSGDVSLSANERNMLDVRWGKSRYTVPGWDGTQFPNRTNLYETVSLTVKQPEFRELLRKTVFAASKSGEKGYHLCGVCLTLKDGRLTSDATDGAAMSHTEMAVASEYGFRVIVPTRQATEMSRLCRSEEDAELLVTKSHISLIVDGTTFTSLLVEGVFPDILRLLPKSYPVNAAFNRQELLDALERAATVKKAMRLNLSGDGACVEVSGDDGALVDEKVPCALDGNPLVLVLSIPYVMDYLKAIDAPQVTMRLTDKVKPVQLDTAADGSLYALMPLVTY